MFSNLDEQIESTQGEQPTKTHRLFRFAGIAVLALFLFVGLVYLGIALVE